MAPDFAKEGLDEERIDVTLKLVVSPVNDRLEKRPVDPGRGLVSPGLRVEDAGKVGKRVRLGLPSVPDRVPEKRNHETPLRDLRPVKATVDEPPFEATREVGRLVVHERRARAGGARSRNPQRATPLGSGGG
jgi:hypothetical protein